MAIHLQLGEGITVAFLPLFIYTRVQQAYYKEVESERKHADDCVPNLNLPMLKNGNLF